MITKLYSTLCQCGIYHWFYDSYALIHNPPERDSNTDSPVESASDLKYHDIIESMRWIINYITQVPMPSFELNRIVGSSERSFGSYYSDLVHFSKSTDRRNKDLQTRRRSIEGSTTDSRSSGSLTGSRRNSLSAFRSTWLVHLGLKTYSHVQVSSPVLSCCCHHHLT